MSCPAGINFSANTNELKASETLRIIEKAFGIFINKEDNPKENSPSNLGRILNVRIRTGVFQDSFRAVSIYENAG